jgi:hypothetical protein
MDGRLDAQSLWRTCISAWSYVCGMSLALPIDAQDFTFRHVPFGCKPDPALTVLFPLAELPPHNAASVCVLLVCYSFAVFIFRFDCPSPFASYPALLSLHQPMFSLLGCAYDGYI